MPASSLIAMLKREPAIYLHEPAEIDNEAAKHPCITCLMSGLLVRLIVKFGSVTFGQCLDQADQSCPSLERLSRRRTAGSLWRKRWGGPASCQAAQCLTHDSGQARAPWCPRVECWEAEPTRPVCPRVPDRMRE